MLEKLAITGFAGGGGPPACPLHRPGGWEKPPLPGRERGRCGCVIIRRRD